MLTNEWRKATRSNTNGACVEVRKTADAVEVRHSKNPDGEVLSFTFAEWDAFTGGVEDGEFQL